MQTYCLLENHTKEVNCCAFSDEHFATCSGKQAAKVTVITFYSPSCLGQETAKGPFGLRVSCHQPTCLPHSAEASYCPSNC